MTTRSVAIALSVERRLRALCALLLGQQPSSQSRLGESQEEADRNSTGCVACHGQTDSASMHTTGTVRLGCTDCHGGNADVMPPAGAQKGSAGYDEAKKKAHPKPSIPDLWRSSANPVRPFTEWLKETKEYIQFVNPGDLRVAAANLRLRRLSRQGSVRGPHQHDDHRRHALGSGALQQRRISL